MTLPRAIPYEGVGITRERDSGGFVNGKAETTFVNNFYMVGKAGAPSYQTHETFRYQVHAYGQLAVIDDTLRLTCG